MVREDLFVKNAYERALEFYNQAFVVCINCGEKTDQPVTVGKGHWCPECVEGDYDLQ